jgi:hypothetical protein
MTNHQSTPTTGEIPQNKVKIRARRIDTMSANKWEAIANGRPVGRAARKETALKIAREYLSRSNGREA